jgi:signal recognition particle subunit SRP68
MTWEHQHASTQNFQGISRVDTMEITNFIVSGRDKAKLYGDYATYRTQLANRIHNLRKKLGIATKPRAKYTSKVSITGEDIERSHEFVIILWGGYYRNKANSLKIYPPHPAYI